MPPAPRKTPARKRPAAALAASPSPLEPKIEPLVLTSAEEPEEVEMVELVSIDGKPYMIPARPPAGLALTVFDDMERYNEGFATLKLLRTLLGEDAYQELAAFPGLKASHLKQLASAVTKLTLGALDEDDPAGN